MKKLESSFKNMVIVLTSVTVIAGALLGLVNDLTSAPIAAANAKALNEALAVVLPEGYDNNPSEAADTLNLEGGIYIIYKALLGEQLVGAAVESVSGGFGGNIKVLVGFDKEGVINDYSVLMHAETPGLGSKAGEWFKAGAKGDITGKCPREPLTVSKDGGQIDAITASTITSRAFLLAVNNAYAAFASTQGEQVDVQTAATAQAEKADEPAAEETADVEQN